MSTPTQPRAVGPIRLETLHHDPSERQPTLDGAWWPQSRDLAEEIPALVCELHARGTRVSRVLYNPDSWDSTEHTLVADGRKIRLGWFKSMDPHLLTVTGTAGVDRLDLLIVPPGTAPAAAERAMAAAVAVANHDSASTVLDTSGSHGAP
jgi:hypothetical protein